MTLPACAPRLPIKSASSPTAIAVDTHTAPPAELLRCPERPEGFTAEAWAVMPKDVRATVVRLAKAFGANADRLERLIAWETGKPCDGATPAAEGAR